MVFLRFFQIWTVAAVLCQQADCVSSASRFQRTAGKRSLLLRRRTEDSKDATDSSFFRKLFKFTLMGCMDKKALNYNSKATIDDGTCIPTERRDPLEDGRFKYYRSDMDRKSPFYVDPELRRIWRNGHFDRGFTTAKDVDMTEEEKVRYGLMQRTNSGEHDKLKSALVLPVGEPIPQILDVKIHAIELQDMQNASPDSSIASSTAQKAVLDERQVDVPMTVMGVPADVWPNPVNVPAYHAIPV